MLQVRVEHARHVAHEDTPKRRQLNLAAAQSDQSLAFQVLKPGELALPPLGGPEVHPEVAHDAVDDPAPAAVVGAAAESALGCEPALADRRVVVREAAG